LLETTPGPAIGFVWLCFLAARPIRIAIRDYEYWLNAILPILTLALFFQIPVRNTHHAVLGTPYGVLSTKQIGSIRRCSEPALSLSNGTSLFFQMSHE
jgi:hypothetical protein